MMSHKKIRWALVDDYENTGTLDCVDFQIYQRIYVFCGSKNSKINLGEKAISEFLHLEIIRLKTISPNNLDFHMAYYLGKLSETASNSIGFDVFTNDNGFNFLIKHINETGRNCQKVSFQSKSKKKPSPQLSACAKQVVSRLKSMDGKKRPKKMKTLANWIASQCQKLDKNVNSQTILDELTHAGILTSMEKGVQYQLKKMVA